MLSRKKRRIVGLISFGGVIIVLTLFGIGPWAGPKPVRPGEEPIATPDQIDVHIDTDKTEYEWDDPIEVTCKIKNLTGQPLRLDEHLWRGLSKGIDQIWKICWAENKGGSLVLSDSSGKKIELYNYGNEPYQGPRYLGPSGSVADILYSPKLLDLKPGKYTLTFTVMGKSASCEFTVLRWW